MTQNFVPLTENGFILKRIIRESVPGDAMDQSPKVGDEVAIHYTGYLEDKSIFFDSSQHNASPFYFRLHKDQVLEGIDLAVASMKKGERSEFRIHPPYAFGEKGLPPTIPPNSCVTFDIELVDWKEFYMVDKDQMTIGERLQAAVVGKEKGNEYFKKKDFVAALERYKKAIHLIEPSDPDSTTLPEDFQKVLVSSYLNASNCSLALKNYRDAVLYSSKALVYHPTDCKALFRCGLGYLELRDFEKSRDFLWKAAKQEPKNVEIRSKLDLWKAAMMLNKWRQKRFFGGILNSTNDSKSVGEIKQLQDISSELLVGFVIKIASEASLLSILVHVDSNNLSDSHRDALCRLWNDTYQMSNGFWLSYRDIPVQFIHKGVMIQAGLTTTPCPVTPLTLSPTSSMSVYPEGSFCMNINALENNQLDFFVVCGSSCCTTPDYVKIGYVFHGTKTLQHLQELPVYPSFKPKISARILMSQVL